MLNQTRDPSSHYTKFCWVSTIFQDQYILREIHALITKSATTKHDSLFYVSLFNISSSYLPNASNLLNAPRKYRTQGDAILREPTVHLHSGNKARTHGHGFGQWIIPAYPIPCSQDWSVVGTWTQPDQRPTLRVSDMRWWPDFSLFCGQENVSLQFCGFTGSHQPNR